jgi:hypothetical protein
MHGTINVKSRNSTSKWQMGFNSAFKGLKHNEHSNAEGFIISSIYVGPEGSKFYRPDRTSSPWTSIRTMYIPLSQKGLYLGAKEMSLECLQPGGDLGIRAITFPSHYKLEENYNILQC